MVANFGSWRNHFRNAGSLLVFKSVIYILYFISIPLYIKNNGTESFGIISILMVFMTYSVFMENGFSYAVVFKYTGTLVNSNKEEDRKRLIQTASFVYVAISMAAFSFVYFFSEHIAAFVWGNTQYRKYIELASIPFAIQILSALPSAVIQAHNNLVVQNLNRMALDMVRVASLLYASYFNSSITTILLFFCASSVMKLMLDIFFCVLAFDESDIFYPKICLKISKDLFSASFYMTIISFASMYMSLFDKTFLSSHLNPVEYSYFALASDLCTKSNVLFSAVSATFFNGAIRYYLVKSQHKDSIIQYYFIALLIIAIFFFLPLNVFADFIFSFFIKSGDVGAVKSYVHILTLYSLIYLTFNIFEMNVVAMGYVKEIAATYIIGGLFIFLSKDLFLERFGSIGVTYGVGAAMLLMLLMSVILYRVLQSRLIHAP